MHVSVFTRDYVTFVEGRYAVLKIADKFEQHVCVKFCTKLGKSVTETLEMLHQVFGEHCVWAVRVPLNMRKA